MTPIKDMVTGLLVAPLVCGICRELYCNDSAKSKVLPNPLQARSWPASTRHSAESSSWRPFNLLAHFDWTIHVLSNSVQRYLCVLADNEFLILFYTILVYILIHVYIIINSYIMRCVSWKYFDYVHVCRCCCCWWVWEMLQWTLYMVSVKERIRWLCL